MSAMMRDLPAGSVVSADEALRRLDQGLWRHASLWEYLDEAVARHPDRVAAVSVDHEGRTVREMTFSELDAMSRRVAAGLQSRGVVPRDVVSVMMTNSAEFLGVVYGVLRTGATYSGIPITYGSHEVKSMTSATGTTVLIVSRHHGSSDVVATALPKEVLGNVALTVVVVGEPVDGTLSLDGLMGSADSFVEVPADPLGPAQLAFTSGTTSTPKAVMNLHATLDVVVRGWAAHVGPDSLGQPMRNLVMSPVGHSTGFFWGALFTVYLCGTAVFMEKWSPEVGAQVLESQRITCMVGSPTFLIDLIRSSGLTREHARDLALVAVAGAPIPRPLMSEAEAVLGCSVIPAWGMTEFGIAVSGRPGLGDINRTTDGLPLANAEVSVRTADSVESVTGEVGDLWLRGTGLFVGYHNRPEATVDAFDEDGWFATGDTAIQHADGSVTITGRTKDIIIRGGENIPVGAVESQIFRHPAVTDVAVVGYADDRLGERACAFVRCRPGTTVTVDSLREFLIGCGLAKRYCPERVVVVDDLPKTMSGKIRKVELRERLAHDDRN
ncbi:cyclohexanecarboxylate--CoA ligase [Rhodococcus sp. 15-725-2-2b]|jgi:cyclohexanecarboxylate-CoA ligase|uniref:AMP-binding protein n=1 Tax=unclassified Rhodococcus (in: high G+C Gram-positive bacteria) TaxID=192944 RepID=UPI000B9C2A0C|nr:MULTISPECIES: AMP-binding protein [unclassified Rhodococcus (in: high G+C Gram-positive bacteria)]OZC61939.1 cyclohexanecarboxylate--CoA ligase [Rhodococcus sp. 06-470-2]OZC64563.1 cyclohexanecarboxylate--CoA ligase [Rhodococcus sp. 06-469-3-2]OZD51197.1 cyclohexanecarboxylate--CoA ligase [Rhodococcus sp. 06-1477-1A]OZE58068.1 cyclohexanecarboxylate--CoA ligase [Rhodococcus sp. 05-2221-1B]OZE71636.1 cyclohexanecarboxylate--CoA ligase [Rhodococcus sp. 15-725-2-2b]